MQKEKQKVNDERLHILSPQLRLTPLAETQNTAKKLLKSYESATTTSKNNLPTHMRTNKSKDKRIWEESDEPTKTPHEGVKGYTHHCFALSDELREHPLSPWDEQEAKLTRAKVNAPHPIDTSTPDAILNKRPTVLEVKEAIAELPPKSGGPTNLLDTTA